MKANKFQKMMSVASTIVPAADRHETPDLTQPPTTGMGLTTQRVKLEQKNTALSAENESLRRQLAEVNEGKAPALELSLSQIEPNPWQPRRKLDVAALAENVKLVGILQPIIVRRHPKKEGLYQILAGERRLRAAKQAGLTTIPVRLLDVDDASMAILALTENIDREDLTDYEVGRSLAGIQQRFPEKKQLAEAVGLSRSSLYRYLSFMDLPDFMQADLDEEPALMGGTLASELATYLKSNQDASVLARLKECWGSLKDGTLQQAQFLLSLKKSPQSQSNSKASAPVVTPLLMGNKKAGSIKKDNRNLVISLKTTVLSEHQEQQIRTLLAKLFK